MPGLSPRLPSCYAAAMRENLTDILNRRGIAGDLTRDPHQIAVAEQLELLRVWLENHSDHSIRLFGGLFAKPKEPPKSLYLWGGVGRGKSMLMDMFVEATDIAKKRRVHFHAFMQEAHRAIHQARKTGAEDPLAPFADAITRDLRLLAFDEMQITDITDAMIVSRLFERLWAGGLIIVATSNRPPEDLYKNGLNRALFLPFVALLNSKMQVMQLEGTHDYRRDKLVGVQVYFHPAGTARRQMDLLWRALIGTSQPAPLTLQVNGRQVELACYVNGSARASFWDLCAKPLGPADFLAIAAVVRVLVLEDIPQMSASNYNEAKRFVTLIDALYEARTRLICSAADTPERLYIEGEGAFEFARTASRLREMQSADWGHQLTRSI